MEYVWLVVPPAASMVIVVPETVAVTTSPEVTSQATTQSTEEVNTSPPVTVALDTSTVSLLSAVDGVLTNKNFLPNVGISPYVVHPVTAAIFYYPPFISYLLLAFAVLTKNNIQYKNKSNLILINQCL
jgi:Flp pilus assembly protein TadG